MRRRRQLPPVADRPIQEYPYPPYSQPQRAPPPQKQGMSPGLIVAIVLVVVLVVVGIAAFMFFSFLSSIQDEPWEDTQDFESDVEIAEGGHFRYTLTQFWQEEMEVNLTVSLLQGASFDVYIMDGDQYENAYGNASTGAFSAVDRWQNVTNVYDIVTYEEVEGPLYLVVDNVRMAHVAGSAHPTGPIHVELELHLVYRSSIEW